MDSDDKTKPTPPSSTQKGDLRRLRALWGGFIIYFLIILNSVRYVYVVPYEAVVLGGIANFGIIGTIIYAIRRIYRRTGLWLPF